MGLDCQFNTKEAFDSGNSYRPGWYFRKHHLLNSFMIGLRHDDIDYIPNPFKMKVTLDDVLQLVKVVDKIFDYYPPAGLKLCADLYEAIEEGQGIWYEGDW